MASKKWSKILLKELCTRIGDGLHGTPKYVLNSGIYFINGNNLKNGKIAITNDTKNIAEFELSKNFIPLDNNSLLVSINGTLGSMAFYNNERVILGKSAAYLNFKTNINQFYYYYFQLKGVQEHLYNIATGSTIKNLSLKSIQDFEVPVPRETEWEGIVEVLKSLDAKIEVNNKINQELEAMTKTLYDYWFVQFDFPAHLSDTLSGVEGYKSTGGKMVFNEELKREIPEGWENGSFEDVAQVIGGSTPSKAVATNFTINNGMPWITPRDLSSNKGKKYITRGEFDVTEKGIKKGSLKLMPAGTILLSSRAPIGYLAIARKTVTTNQGFKSFVPKDYFTSEFLYYQIKNKIPLIEARSGGSTFKEVSASILKAIKIVKPPKEIINEYQNIAKPIFEKQDVLEKESAELSSLRDWLLPMLMNGQVSVGRYVAEPDFGKKYAENEETLRMVAEDEN